MDETELQPMTAQDALCAVMIAVSASDLQMREVEMRRIAVILSNLPVFDGYDRDRLGGVSRAVLDLFDQEDGLDALFGLVRAALPERLHETAYALACDVAAADGNIAQSEARMLEEVREELSIDRLHAAAIERGARARHMTI
ncbi:MAG: tellurite resistance TerB family protein [Paracoccaceae bacterium]